MVTFRLVLVSVLYALAATALAEECPPSGLGVAAITADSGRGPASYLVYRDGRAQIAVDIGPGSARALGRQPELTVLLLTSLRVEQTADLATLVASYQQSRHTPLTVYGPPGSRAMPSTTTFVRTMFDGTRGAYRYLGEVVSPLSKERFRLNAHDVTPPRLRPGVREVDPTPVLWEENGLSIRGAATGTGNASSLAWRVQTADRAVAVLDSASVRTEALATLLNDTDLVIARVQTIDSDGALLGARALGALLHAAGVRQLVLANMPPVGQATLADIRRSFTGSLKVLDPGACVIPVSADNSESVAPRISDRADGG